MLTIGGKQFQSRLLLGTGKYPSFEIQKEAVAVSESDILTFAVRRMNIFEESQPNFLEQLDLSKYTLLPNTAGAATAEEAVRIARLAKASGLCDMIKVEVIGCGRSLLPDPVETLKASEQSPKRDLSCFRIRQMMSCSQDVLRSSGCMPLCRVLRRSVPVREF